MIGLFIFGIAIAFGISVSTGRLGWAISISLVVWILGFTILNTRHGNFYEPLQYGLAMSMFEAIPHFIAASIGVIFYSNKAKIEEKLNMEPSKKE